MPKNRAKQRQNRQFFLMEEARLMGKNEFDVSDPTPKEAIDRIINKNKDYLLK